MGMAKVKTHNVLWMVIAYLYNSVKRKLDIGEYDIVSSMFRAFQKFA